MPLRFCPTSRTVVDAIQEMELDSKAQLEPFRYCDKKMPKLKKLALINQDPYNWTFALPLGFEAPIVEDLELVAFNLEKYKPNFIFKATNLKRLVLRRCALKKFPDFILACKDLEELDLSYNHFIELPDALFQLPKLRRLSFGNHVNPEGENFPVWGTDTNAQARFMEQVANCPQIEVLGIATSPVFPLGIEKCVQLSELYIYPAFSSSSFFSGSSFDPNNIYEYQKKYGSLSFVKLLNEESQATQTAWFEQVAALPRLKQLFVVKTNLFPASLDALATSKSLEIFNFESFNWSMSEIYENYDWSVFKGLKHLSLNFASAVLPVNIKQLPLLESLVFHNFRVKHLHLSNSLPSLHTLQFEFEYKSYLQDFESVSDDFLRLLPQLTLLGIDNYTTGVVVKQIKDVRSLGQDYPNEVQQMLDLLLGNNITQIPDIQLLKYLSIRPAQLNLKAWELLLARHDSPEKIQQLGLEKISKYFLLGTPTLATDFKQLLQTQAWKATKKIQEAELIILCQTVKTLPAPESIVWAKTISETALLVWLEAQQGFERLDTDSNQNLQVFLGSPDRENVLLGLDIMSKTYSSDKLVDTCLMGLALFSPDKEIKEKVKKLISKNWSAELLQLFKQHNRRGHEKECYEALLEHPLLDKLTFANIATIATLQNSNLYYWQRFGQKDVAQLGGAGMSAAVQSFFSYNRFELPELESYHPSFFEAIEHLDQIQHFQARNLSQTLQQQIFKLRLKILTAYFSLAEGVDLEDSIGKMQSLRDLQLSSKTSHLDGIGKLTDLEELRIDNPTLKALPATLANLKKLNRCNLMLHELSELPDWLHQWENLKELLVTESKYFDLRPLFLLPKLVSFYIRQNESHPTNWKGFTQKMYWEHISSVQLEICSPNAEIAQQTFTNVLQACGNKLQTFIYADPLFSDIPDVWEQLKKVNTVQISGTFKTIPVPTAPVEITRLGIFSEQWENVDLDWSQFTYLQTLEIYKKFPADKERALRKILPKHIKIRHSYR